MIKFTSTTQSLIALSVAEAELFAAVKCTSMLIGLPHMATEWGLTLKMRLYSNSTSARGIAARRGVGKIRHLDTQLLWIQQVVQRKVMEWHNVATTANVADLGTKTLEWKDIAKFINLMGLKWESGQSSLALKAAA